MATSKKNKKTPIIQIVMVVLISVVIIWQVSDLFTSDVSEGAQLPVSQDQDKQNVSTEDKSSVAAIPIRMNSAPDYDDILMAATIYKQAINQTEAKHFIRLKMSERSLALSAKIIKTQREMAEDSFKLAEFKKRKGDLSNDPEDTTDSTSEFVSNNEYPAPILSTDQIQGPIDEMKVGVIQVKGWSGSGRITMTNDGKYANNIRLSQVLWGRYLVKEINAELKCVNLFDEKASIKIPMICFN
ncbi:hypothetical protein [Moritella sp. F3]|uniref:hypothetical protein n=1 Tax=Moritella sp. F3 TaxID=2718882 RepID=UPI0018E1A48C|nr:hypothetical protein [Moritella sp. F3]GIC77215.1 hypothetical protein FMO001_19420 [Moritella sp. F1]GIC82334.1 hypothetical protein FMO003_26150 [Moritella sp. F3]